jgi:IS5 family transposase
MCIILPLTSSFPLSQKKKGQYGFFDYETQLDKIYQINDFLPKLNALIDWEMFRSVLDQVREPTDPANGGRPPFDVVLMFKILVLKKMYNLSDAQTELQIRDRISFRAFLGLNFCDTVPDEKTIWFFAEQLKNLELECLLFDRFSEELDASGFAVKSGLIVDGSFVEVPRQRNSREENEQIKQGEIPESFAANPNVLAQKDCDARWTKKGDQVFYGYENHGMIDDEFKFIRGYGVTDAAVHDSVPYLDVMPEEPAYPDQEAFADAAYVGDKIDTSLKERGFLPMISEKGYRNKPLTEEQKRMNKMKSSVRSRVEHVFGAQKMRMGNEILRSIGFGRARFWIGMRNLMYNMSRYVSLKCPKKVPKPVKVR